jgi:polysaccharide biosynthesis transport protein
LEVEFMSDRSIIEAPEPGGRSLRMEQYLPEPYAEQRQPASRLDISWLRGTLFRQRWLMIAALAVAIVGGIVITLITTPTYEAVASVRLNPRSNYITEGEDVARQIIAANEVDNFLRTQVEILKSRNLAETVARELSLGKRSALLGDMDTNRPPNLSDEAWEEAKIKRAAAELQANVVPEIVGTSTIIAIRFQSSDRVLAAEVANAYVKSFTQSDIRQSLDANAYARDYLQKQIEEVRARLGEAETQSNSYARNQGIVTEQTTSDEEGEGGGVTITGANLSSINQTVSAARAARIAAEQKWRAIANLPASQLPETMNSPLVQNLAAERAKLNAELSVLRQRYNDDFPAIVEIRSRLDYINQQIERTGAEVKGTIRSQYLIAQQQERALEAELNSVTGDALAEQEKKVEFTSLEREAAALRTQLRSLLDRFAQVSTASNVQSSTVTPLDTAIVPTSPVSPSLVRNLVLAIVLGLGMGGALALIREIFVDQFRRVEDVEDRLGLPALGITPYLKDKDIKTEEANQFGALMEAYSAIRSTIDYAIPRSGWVVQMTSSQASEGKSTTALILAQMFARLGRKTLLIDVDLRKPSVHALLDIERPSAGIAEVLLGHVTFDEAKLEGVAENLTVLTVAGIPPDPVGLICSPAFREFLEARRQEFSLVMLDSSPLLGLADAVEIAKQADTSIFVVEANRTSVAQGRSAVKRLAAVGANVMGVILTKYRTMEAGDDYGYQYNYYQYGKE